VVYATQWNNPRPEQKIQSVDILAVEDGKWGVPAVFAITAANAER
jgi:hypothetical protein